MWLEKQSQERKVNILDGTRFLDGGGLCLGQAWLAQLVRSLSSDHYASNAILGSAEI